MAHMASFATLVIDVSPPALHAVTWRPRLQGPHACSGQNAEEGEEFSTKRRWWCHAEDGSTKGTDGGEALGTICKARIRRRRGLRLPDPCSPVDDLLCIGDFCLVPLYKARVIPLQYVQ